MEHPEETWENLIFESFSNTPKDKIILPDMGNFTNG